MAALIVRLVANNDGPGPNLPSSDKTVCHVGIPASEVFNDAAVIGAKDQQGAVGGLSQCPGEHDLATSVGFLSELDVLFSERQSLICEVINDIIEQSVISHRISPQRRISHS